MKLDPMEAIQELQEMLNLIPVGQSITIKGQRKEAALLAAIEALRRQAGFPPNLPGYVTIDKVNLKNVRSIACLKEWQEAKIPKTSCYTTRITLGALAAVYGEEIVTYTERTCYKDSEPLLCGLPVIYGDTDALDGYVYIVALENKHK